MSGVNQKADIEFVCVLVNLDMHSTVQKWQLSASSLVDFMLQSTEFMSLVKASTSLVWILITVNWI